MGSLKVGLGTKAGGGLEVATGLVAGWDWEDWELFLVGGLVMVVWACTCGGEAEIVGDAE